MNRTVKALVLTSFALTLVGCEWMLGPFDGDSGTPPPTCGNGLQDEGETCDVGISAGFAFACPATCDDQKSCTRDQLVGMACIAHCEHTEITTCQNGDGCCPAGCTGLTDTDCPALKRVFITSTVHTGNLATEGQGFGDGLAGADHLCNNRAFEASLGGTWKAWLSTSTVNAKDRMADVGPWVLVGTSTVVFDSKAAMTSAPKVVINRTQAGETLPGTALVWTATLNDGTLYYLDCYDWTSGRTGDFGSHGDTSTPANWTTINSVYCDSTLHLYCFEQ